MIKKTLLTGICFSSLFAMSMSSQAAQQRQQTVPTGTHPQSGQPMAHQPGEHPPSGHPSHCPPCPCMGGDMKGGGMGWVLIPYGSMPGGMPCDQKSEHEGKPPMHHEPTTPVHHEPTPSVHHEPPTHPGTVHPEPTKHPTQPSEEE